MMTFSLNPRRLSILDRVAASVRTRVVSWKDAALRKLSVSSDALVMPSRTGVASAGFAAHLVHPLVLLFKVELVNLFAPQERCVARFGDAHLAQHLAHDDFDVLVVNGNALEAVNLLHFADEVFLQFLRAAHLEDFVRVNRAFRQLLALS